MKTLWIAVAAASFAVAGCSKGFEQNISTVGNTMAYDVTTFTVKAGEKVHIVLKNNGDNPAMQHNWVLVKPGTETAVATAGIEAGPALGYLKAGDANIIAATPLSQPGATVEVSFTAPAKGTYPYICTFPGHYQAMKGTLTVTD